MLMQALPQAGWGASPESRREATEQLWMALQNTHPKVDETAARQRFAILLFTAERLLGLGKPEGKKPSTWLRDQITGLLRLPPAEAIALLEQDYPVLPARGGGDETLPVRLLAHYLDLPNEAEDLSFRPELLVQANHSKELGQRRYAFLQEHGADLTPLTTRGPDAVWGVIAEVVAEALIELTDEWPVRSVVWMGDREGQEGGWGLEFFRTFAGMVTFAASEHLAHPSEGPPPSQEQAPRPDPDYDKAKVWRRALKHLSAQGLHPGLAVQGKPSQAASPSREN